MAELLYVISSQLTKFIRADKFLLTMPLQHKFANRLKTSVQFSTKKNKFWQFWVVIFVFSGMKFITGKDRSQTEFFCLEQAIAQDNEVRLIDLFVNAVNLSDHGFDMSYIDNGRPAYHPSDLLKLFIYGYLNRIRSSPTGLSVPKGHLNLNIKTKDCVRLSKR